MNLSILSGRAKWCVWCSIALACSAPTLSFAERYPFDDNRLQLANSMLMAGAPHRLRNATRQPDATVPLIRYFDDVGNKPAGETHFLVVNGGFLGIFNRFPETLRYGAEYRWRELGQLKLRPSAGVVTAENDASYYFLGLRRDFLLTDRLLLTGSFDAGYFEERDEIKLGLQMEFRSGAELSYRFNKQYRIGLALYHLSNGGFGDRNPGTESVVLSLIAPIY